MDTDNAMLNAQYVTVMNHGGFIMSFAVSRADGAQAGATEYYPVQQTRSVDLATLRFGAEQQPLEPGDEVCPVVSVVAGVSKTGPAMRYAANSQQAVYVVTGTPLTCDIRRY
ncbi:hypothetical protein [Rheinheimera sp.]|jgi:hypothetical protein|uniref:hypothetical protein n=1 Tax=Rheinheimera sp. TaxID=1869214 RepID=UPI003D2E3A7A